MKCKHDQHPDGCFSCRDARIADLEAEVGRLRELLERWVNRSDTDIDGNQKTYSESKSLLAAYHGTSEQGTLGIEPKNGEV